MRINATINKLNCIIYFLVIKTMTNNKQVQASTLCFNIVVNMFIRLINTITFHNKPKK